MTVVARRKAEIRVSEGTLSTCLARNTFKDAVCVVDRCTYTGYECDLLVVHPSLRFIDVEVKISRADLKADRLKDKWFTPPAYWTRTGRRPDPIPRDWPSNVWKHYYAMPEELWKDYLTEYCKPTSGILLITPRAGNPRFWSVRCLRRAKPNPKAKVASGADLVHVARLASLRMWDAYHRFEQMETSNG